MKVKKGFADTLPELKALSKNATSAGIVCSILSQFSNSGMLRYDGDKVRLFPEGLSRNNGICVAGAGLVAGLMKWLYDATAPEAESKKSFKTLNRLRKVMHVNPAMSEVVKCVDKWQKQLAGEMKGFQNKYKRDMRVDEVFVSLLTALSGLKLMKGTNLPSVIDKYRRADGMGITRIPLVEALSRQAMPVVLNEIMVRTAYFTVRLAKELATHEDVAEIDWDGVVPFANRTIGRMIAVASMTFTTADTVDAAIHAATESAGNAVLFSGIFVKHYNYIGFGRAAVAVYREIAAESVETELLYERRLLTEAQTAQALAQLEAYQARMKRLFNLERFAFVDEEGLIYTATGMQNDIDQYKFDYKNLEGPEISIKNLKSAEKHLIIAVPTDKELNGKKLQVCFMEISMEELLNGVSIQAQDDSTTFCNLYTSDGVALSNTILGGLAVEDNLLDALKNADFEEGYSYEQVVSDFGSGTSGVASFVYNGIRETRHSHPELHSVAPDRCDPARDIFVHHQTDSAERKACPPE